MYGTAKYLKDRAATARRAATALRGLSGDPEMDVADKGLLLKAAQVLDSIGNSTAKAAKARKQEEEARERAIAAARKIAAEKVAAWPIDTPIKKVALIFAAGYRGNLWESIKRDSAESLRRSIAYWVETARDDLATTAAHRSVRTNRDVAEIIDEAVKKFEAMWFDQSIVDLAARIQPYISNESEVAA